MEEIQVYNNLTKEKEKLVPHSAPTLNIYTCGPTVYDHSHIGHARSSLTWDIIVRYLRFAGYEVNWSRNITDIDDKILNRSTELKISPDKLARIYTYSFHEDMINLGIEWPDYEPQATQYIQEMCDFIQGLIDQGHAYAVDSDVYFSISSFKEYGKLKGQKVEDLEKGVGRIDKNSKKKHNLDFALWKGVKDESEYGFNSPWGKGRPGWHLECSTMNFSIYGSNLDIHGGGDDLIFPHHENEIAQSEAFTKKTFAKYWLHNGMINVNGGKMSKSEGNFITIKEALKTSSGEAIRFFVLNTHYRMPLNYTEEALTSAQNGVNRLKESLNNFEADSNATVLPEFIDKFKAVMNDDFATSQALAILFNLVDLINTEKSQEKRREYQSTLYQLTSILGFNLLEKGLSKNKTDKCLESTVDSLLLWRSECKEKKDYQSADRIRNLLINSKIEVKDLPENKQEWKIKL